MDKDRLAPGSPRATLQQRLADARKEQEPPPEARARRGGIPTRPSQAEQWGLTPGVTLVLIVVAGVAMVAGLILAVSAPSSQAAAPDAAAAVVAPTLLPAARPPAEGAIDDYLMLIRQEMFETAWGRTTARFQANNYPSGIAAYEQAWAGSAELEVVSKKVILHTDDQVNVLAEIHDLGSDTTYTNTYSLVFDGASGLWLIDAVNRIW